MASALTILRIGDTIVVSDNETYKVIKREHKTTDCGRGWHFELQRLERPHIFVTIEQKDMKQWLNR